MVYLCSYTFATSQAIVTVANGASTGFLRTNSIKLVPEVSVDYFVCTGSMGYGGSLYGEVGTWSTAGGGYSGYGRNPERTSSSPNAQATFMPQVPLEVAMASPKRGRKIGFTSATTTLARITSTLPAACL
jgi:hypothetical protein